MNTELPVFQIKGLLNEYWIPVFFQVTAEWILSTSNFVQVITEYEYKSIQFTCKSLLNTSKYRIQYLIPEGRCVANPVGVQLFLLVIYLGQEILRAFQKFIWFLELFLLQNVLSPDWRCVAYPVGVQLFYSWFIWVKKSLEPFKNSNGFSNFFLLQNFFFSRREIRSISSRVQLFLLVIYLV